jgi:hypothetical protein
MALGGSGKGALCQQTSPGDVADSVSKPIFTPRLFLLPCLVLCCRVLAAAFAVALAWSAKERPSLLACLPAQRGGCCSSLLPDPPRPHRASVLPPGHTSLLPRPPSAPPPLSARRSGCWRGVVGGPAAMCPPWQRAPLSLLPLLSAAGLRNNSAGGRAAAQHHTTETQEGRRYKDSRMRSLGV